MQIILFKLPIEKRTFNISKQYNIDLPDLLWMDDVKAGPTAIEGFLTFLHFIKIEIAPRRTIRSTNADRAIMAMVLTFIFWFLVPKLAVIGRFPALAVGPLPMKLPYGGEEGIPNNKIFTVNKMIAISRTNQVTELGSYLDN